MRGSVRFICSGSASCFFHVGVARRPESGERPSVCAHECSCTAQVTNRYTRKTLRPTFLSNRWHVCTCMPGRVSVLNFHTPFPSQRLRLHDLRWQRAILNIERSCVLGGARCAAPSGSRSNKMELRSAFVACRRQRTERDSSPDCARSRRFSAFASPPVSSTF